MYATFTRHVSNYVYYQCNHICKTSIHSISTTSRKWKIVWDRNSNEKANQWKKGVRCTIFILVLRLYDIKHPILHVYITNQNIKPLIIYVKGLLFTKRLNFFLTIWSFIRLVNTKLSTRMHAQLWVNVTTNRINHTCTSFYTIYISILIIKFNNNWNIDCDSCTYAILLI